MYVLGESPNQEPLFPDSAFKGKWNPPRTNEGREIINLDNRSFDRDRATSARRSDQRRLLWKRPQREGGRGLGRDQVQYS